MAAKKMSQPKVLVLRMETGSRAGPLSFIFRAHVRMGDGAVHDNHIRIAGAIAGLGSGKIPRVILSKERFCADERSVPEALLRYTIAIKNAH